MVMRRIFTYLAILAAAATLFACGGTGVEPVDTSKEPDTWKPVGGDDNKDVIVTAHHAGTLPLLSRDHTSLRQQAALLFCHCRSIA